MFAENVEKYWTYQGSFCAPPCYETVTWIVFETPSHITARVVRIGSQKHSLIYREVFELHAQR